jgi:hypothetical protein
MPHNENFLKVLYDRVVKHENIHVNILFNVLAYLLFKKQAGNTFTIELYDKMYNKNDTTSFISTMKSKYNLDIIILEKVDIEKIINTNINNISIEDIITTLNLKTIQYTNYVSYSMDIIKPSIKDLSDLSNKSSVLIMSSYLGEYNKFINDINYINNLDIFEINNENAILSQMEYDLNYSKNNNSKTNSMNIRCQDYIHHNVITKSYDMILCNFPNGLRNIIHANCCDKIKRLKIRGTKSEPLILQLIMMSLNNNGKACIIVPNTLLNNDSKQHVETRNYLINNFNVTNIINCDNNLSILYFEKNGLTKQTTFSKIENNNIVKLFDVYYDKIVKRNYNLYYEKYINIDCSISSCENKQKLVNLVDVVEVLECSNNNCNYLRIPKFLNDNQKVEILFDNCDLNTDNQNENISLKIRDTNIINQKYFNYYFLYVLSPVLITTTSCKSKKLDINILLDTEINIPNIEIQNNIVEFFDISYLNINQIKKQIKSIQLLKNKFIENIINKYPFVKLKELCDIDAKPHNICNNDCSGILCVQRNSKSAGNTFYYDFNDEPLNTNVYYLNNINSKNININVSTLYILLKYNEAKLNKLASITNTINLSKTNLENFEIKNIPINIQEIINNKINEYDNMISSLVKNVENLINTNIFASL